jgi:hypothetical protein
MAEETGELKTTLGAGFGDAFSSMDIDWTDDGELVLRDRGVTDEGELTNEPAEETETEVETAPVEGGEDSDAGAEGAEEEAAGAAPEENAELAAVKAELEALKEQLATKDKTPEDQVQATEQITVDSLIPPDKDLMDVLSDRKEGVEFLQNAFEVMINPLIDHLRPMVIQWRVHQEATQMFQKYGEDFTEKLPIIKTLVQKRPDLTFDQAYQLVKTAVPETKSPAKTGQVEAQDEGSSQAKVNEAADAVAEAKAIAEKAQKLRTEQGIAGNRNDAGPATSIRQALSDAVDEHLSNV